MCATCGCTAAAPEAQGLSKDALDAIGDDQIAAFNVDGHAVAIARSAGQLFALDDMCTHAECPLSDGEVEDGEVICSCHGSRFDLRTGDVIAGPATEPVPSYQIQIDGDSVVVKLS